MYDSPAAGWAAGLLRLGEELCGLVDEMLSLWAEDLRGWSCTGPTSMRTDFAFLPEQAERLSRDWCVVAGPDGARTSRRSCPGQILQFDYKCAKRLAFSSCFCYRMKPCF